MAMWGTLNKQYEMTVAHPCLHEEPRWNCFHILNGLNHALICLTTTKIKNQDNSSPHHKTLFSGVLFVIHSDLFQESSGTEMYLSRPSVCSESDLPWISCPRVNPSGSLYQTLSQSVFSLSLFAPCDE